MTKTTNYEISKKLAEIGFRAETGFYWYEYDKGKEMRYIADADGAGKYKAYDLETMLDALPDLILGENKYKENYRLTYNSVLGFFYPNLEKGFYKKENESLADTAGRLIILLHEKNLIKF